MQPGLCIKENAWPLSSVAPNARWRQIAKQLSAAGSNNMSRFSGQMIDSLRRYTVERPEIPLRRQFYA